MTPRQCEIAAESYAASLLARAGYDVLVQYGANQPQYDLVAVKAQRMLKVSVKGSQDGGWMLAVRYKEKGVDYHGAIDRWLKAQHNVVYVFVQFIKVSFGEAPRVYVAKPPAIAKHLKTQCAGRGYGALQEEIRRDVPGGKYDHRIPESWRFTEKRIDAM